MARAGYVPERGDFVRVCWILGLAGAVRRAQSARCNLGGSMSHWLCLLHADHGTAGWPFEVLSRPAVGCRGRCRRIRRRASITRHATSASWQRHQMAWLARSLIA